MGRESSSPAHPSMAPPTLLALSVPSPPQTTMTKVQTTTTTTPTALAPGFRFHPTDEELVIYYLKRKVCGKPFRFNAITEVDVYKSEPWDLADKSSLKSRDQEYYFFSALDRKYGNGARMNRATNQGYWKATGNDRPVRHDSRTVGLKKTLVFHSGRAPDGKRTNWVMHEYRIVDEELEKAGVGAAQDAFVLCRIFHKSNIGPPSGQRYAPFIEEEWDDDDSAVVPGVDNANEVVARRHAIGGNGHRMYIESNAHDTLVEGDTVMQALDLPRHDQNVLSACKIERPDDYPVPCQVNREDSLDGRPVPGANDQEHLSLVVDRVSSPLLMYKRRRHNDSNSTNCNASENSSGATQDRGSSVTTAATTMSTMTTATNKPPTTRNFLSALVEYSLLESIEPKETTPVPPELDAANLDASLPPSCVKFIQDLQNEIHQVSIERDTLKFEMMSAQAMINILQSRIDLLTKENNDLKRSSQGV
ncbi:NAC domain containing protein 50 isoform X2 [Morus notabilis]|uniref:NAC domain containing protein 50 isoform X2 n=1 Tax=Morus notabilis TaxID=981085 RepID=UPI000CED171D|nr:NAC domain containing protein 50 isoform X2 [Morus notabilis]